MSEKQQLIQAFKSLDFEALNNLLDEKRSYSDVSKDLFLSRLKETVDKYSELSSYENVLEGTCNHCNKGCIAYTFRAENCPSLNLFFEEKEGVVTDIYLCNSLKVDTPDEDKWHIYFTFFKEEEVTFEPSLKYSINLQQVDNATEDFNCLAASNLVSVNDLVHWYNRCERLAEDLNLNDPFIRQKYNAFIHIDSLYSAVSDLVHNFNKNYLAQEALKDYERSIISWLLCHTDIYFWPLKKTDNWKKTGFIILETEPNLLIDCIDCLDSFLFDEIYSTIENEIMQKYHPTKEQLDQNGGSVESSLASFLKLQNKYLDLL